VSIPIPKSISPSSISQFQSCPLAFRFAYIERLPQDPSPAASKGTLVHRALELLMQREATERTVEAALADLVLARAQLADDPDFTGLDLTDEEWTAFHADAEVLVRRYFDLEDPTTIEPIGLELKLEATVGRATVRGIIDRLERDAAGRLVSRLVDIREPVACIPSLAIHLDREANDKRSINKQTHLPAIVARAGDGEDFDLRRELLARLAVDEPALAGGAVLDWELALFDLQPAAFVGWRREFIAAARIDNLLSCYTALAALCDGEGSGNRLVVLNDHEEVGSGSAAGARGTFLRAVLGRLSGGGEAHARAMARSLLVSTDNAHGVHPNFADRHDPQHGPLLNAGPVLKINHNQSYATNSETAAWFREACRRAEVPLQQFVTRGDIGCGSTIGPITAAVLGVRTVDVGVPTFAMHSIRELAGREDAWSLKQALEACFALSLPD